MRADPYLSTKKQIYVQYINVYCIYVQYTKILRSGGCMHRSWMVMGHSDHVFKIRVQTVLNPDHYISCARVASATWATYMREGYNTRWCNCGQHDSVLQRIYIYIPVYIHYQKLSYTWIQGDHHIHDVRDMHGIWMYGTNASITMRTPACRI